MPFHRRLACKLNYFQSIILMFAAVILIGAALLMLPISAQERTVTPFHEALFTATSAVCVTGLVVRDTASHWSAFGQAVLMVLIQIGGLGVITVGALCMLPVFCRDFGVSGIWKAVFHSVSAFCNAGFDLMGTPDMPFVSLTAYRADPVINLTISTLIVVGGVGFLTWDDVRCNRLCFHRYRLQSKVILTATALLILLPTLYFFCFEFKGSTLRERLLLSLFQSVTPRTAGFNTADYASLSSSGRGLTILLMFIGGSPGSTAGGIKTTTAAVLVANAFAVFRRQKSPEMFGRRMEEKAVHDAAAIFTLYLVLSLTGAFVISTVETLPLSECLFETTSAIATVGLSLGLTPHLGIVSQGILIFLMFIGRVGGLTMIYAALSGSKSSAARLPQERITVG